MRHNNILPGCQLRKWWQRYVKTWFQQPATKTRRRAARESKRLSAGIRPVDRLRPVVRPPTQRYNYKLRKGRGFTMEELRTVGLNKYSAAQIGIAVDKRRKNRCQESLDLNVQRLKTYLEHLRVYSRRKFCKKGHAGLPDDTPRAEAANAVQKRVDEVVPVPSWKRPFEERVITPEDRKIWATERLRSARADVRYKGKRVKANAEKAGL